MSFLEKIFSLDYIWIPAAFSLFFGFLYIFFAKYTGGNLVDWVLYFISAVGFIIGSLIKVQVMDKQE